jgi:hypothetical protein
MLRETFQTIIIATATLMYLSLEYSLFAELGWQGGLVGSLFLAVFSAATVVSLMRPRPHIDQDKTFDEEGNCLP